MTRIRFWTASALVAGVLASGAAAFAQGTPDGGAGRGPRGGGPGRFGGAGLPLRELNLSEMQMQQLQDIRVRHRDEMRQADERLRAALNAQRQAVEAIPVDEGAIRATTPALAEAQTEAAIVQARVHAESWAILTPEQQAQAKKLEAQRGSQAPQRQRIQRQGQRQRG